MKLLFEDRQFGELREEPDYFSQDPVDAPEAYTALGDIRDLAQIPEDRFDVVVQNLRRLGLA